jgi:hypothetical protein
MFRPLASLLAISLLLTACAGSVVEDIVTLRIGITPTLSSLQPDVHQCASELPVHLLLVEQPFNSLAIDGYDAVIHLNAPPEGAGFTTRVGSTKLVFILNPDNPISTMDATMISSILLGNVTDWQAVSPGDFTNPTPIQVWSYAEQDDLRQQLEENLLDGRSISSSSRLVPDGQAMIGAVKSDPSAIGFITAMTPASDVRVLKIVPGDGFSLPLPVLASVAGNPEGELKLLLFCLAEKGN